MTKKLPRQQSMRTPRWFFDFLDAEFGPFVLDAAATEENALCSNFFTEENSGLFNTWEDITFCNPPFKQIGQWVEKAAHEFQHRSVRSVVLGPASVSSCWFHHRDPGKSVCLPNKRIAYLNPDGSKTSSPMWDSTIVTFGSGMPSIWLLDINTYIESYLGGKV